MVFSTLIALTYAKIFLMMTLVFLFFYNLITDKKKHWGSFFTVMFSIFMIGIYEDELYGDMMYDQLYEDQYNDLLKEEQYNKLEKEQYENIYGKNYDSSKDPNNIYDCADFDTRAEAQSVFERDGGSSIDVHHLDRDGDGIACETLP